MNIKLFNQWKESHHLTERTQDNLIYGTLAVVGVPLALWALWIIGNQVVSFLR